MTLLATRTTIGLLLLALLAAALLPLNAGTAEAYDPSARIVELTNIERQKHGLHPLEWQPNLSIAAGSYAAVLAEGHCWAHTCGPQPDFAQRVLDAGYWHWTTLGENLAAGDAPPEQIVAMWMDSPGHRANILSPHFYQLGVGVAHGGPSGVYWVQEFGG